MRDLAIDLDDRRSQRGHEREARVAGPRVIDREAEAQASQGLDLALEWAEIRDRLLLRALDGDARWRQAGGPDHRRERRRLEGRVEQAGGREVDPEAARFLARLAGDGLEATGPLEDRGDDEEVELDRPFRVDGRRDDGRDRLGQHRHLRAEQALVLVQLQRRQVDDRLERHPVQRPEAEEVVEHLGLDDLGRLRHPDPVREAAELDGGRGRDQVAVGLGQRPVDHDEAVLGVSCPIGDLLDQALVAEGSGRGDQHGPRLELDGPGAATTEASRLANRMSRDHRSRSASGRRVLNRRTGNRCLSASQRLGASARRHGHHPPGPSVPGRTRGSRW